MECTVSWTGAAGTRSAMGFVAETGSGHVIAMDGAPDAAKPDAGKPITPPVKDAGTGGGGNGGCGCTSQCSVVQRRRSQAPAKTRSPCAAKTA